jgi:hypothetical protein
VNSTASWDCDTCDSGIVLKAVIEVNGALALVGYDKNQDALFVAYRGSSNIQNWIDNVKFSHTSPYSDLPDVKVLQFFNVNVEKLISSFFAWFCRSSLDSTIGTLI